MGEQPKIPFRSIQGWLFDLDGTLMDTDDAAVASLAARLSPILGKARAVKAARRLVMASETPGNQLLALADTFGVDAWIFALLDRLKGRAQPTYRLIQGVKELLVELKGQGHALGIVSTRSQDEAQAFLQQHDLSSLFSVCATRETTHYLKPHPEPILYAVTHLGLESQACAMVGDTPVDIRAARRAGAWAIGMLCGFGEPRELRRAGAHLILPSTGDLLKCIQQAQTEGTGPDTYTP